MGFFLVAAIVKLIPIFSGDVACSIDRGMEVAMWHDQWEGRIPSQEFACLYSYGMDEDILVAEFYISTNLIK